jgi:hypothetical protein
VGLKIYIQAENIVLGNVVALRKTAKEVDTV